MTPQQRFAAYEALARKAALAARRRGLFREHDLDAAQNAALWGLWRAAVVFDPRRQTQGEAGFPGFAATLCKRSVIDWLREERGTRRQRPRPVGLDALRDRQGMPREPEAPAVPPTLDTHDAVEFLVGQLPRGRGPVFRLLAAGRTRAEAAQALGLCRSRVSQLVHECLPQLRDEAKRLGMTN